MSNFPSKWFDFTNSKEIKRMRSDINDTLTLKIEISSSIILTIITLFFSDSIEKLSFIWQLFWCVMLCTIVLSIFFVPFIMKQISIKRHSNLIIKGKDAVAIFDEEIVYNVLVAAEYSNSIRDIPSNDIKKDLEKFYKIEIEYYVTLAIDQIAQFNSNYQKIIGNKKNQISSKRIQNIFNLIDSIIKENNIKLKEDKKNLYEEFKKQIANLKK
jgi:hypothetical protein